MLKKQMTFKDFDGVEQTKTFYFNMTKAELAEMELSRKGGLMKHIEKISAEQNGPELFALFKELILMAYGEKSADGSRFKKSQELRDAFEQSQAYSELFMQLATSAEATATFIEGIIPADMLPKKS